MLNPTSPQTGNIDMQERFLKAYDEYADALFKHCYFRVHDRELAKDLVQDTYKKVWISMTQEKNSGTIIMNLRAFLYQTLKNLIIDHYRKKKTDSLDALQDAGFDVASREHEDIMVSAQMSEVMSAIEMLEPQYREVVELRYLSDLGPAEIAEQLGESPNIISVRLNRAIKSLQSILQTT